MSFQEPTYEEYKKASGFARIRYKYGLFVTIACWLCLLFIIYYMISNAEELGSDPMLYAMKQTPRLECHCYENKPLVIDPFDQTPRIDFYVNSSSKWVEMTNVQDINNMPTAEELQEMMDNLGK